MGDNGVMIGPFNVSTIILWTTHPPSSGDAAKQYLYPYSPIVSSANHHPINHSDNINNQVAADNGKLLNYENVLSSAALFNFTAQATATTTSLASDAILTSSVPTNQLNKAASAATQSTKELNNYWALLALVLVFGTAAGNILVCLAIAWERRLQNVTNYFLMSLAITDLMVAVLVMPLGILTLFYGHFPLQSEHCLAWICLDVLFCTASIMHLCTISVDRYLSLRYPMRFGRNKTRRRVTLKIIFVWLLSIAMSLPLSLKYSTNHASVLKDGTCQIPDPVYKLVGSIVCFYIPLGVMLLTYCLTVRLLAQQRQNLGGATPGNGGWASGWLGHTPALERRCTWKRLLKTSLPSTPNHAHSATSTDTELSTLDTHELWLPDSSIPDPTPSTMTALQQFGAEMLKLSRGLESVASAVASSPSSSIPSSSTSSPATLIKSTTNPAIKNQLTLDHHHHHHHHHSNHHHQHQLTETSSFTIPSPSMSLSRQHHGNQCANASQSAPPLRRENYKSSTNRSINRKPSLEYKLLNRPRKRRASAFVRPSMYVQNAANDESSPPPDRDPEEDDEQHQQHVHNSMTISRCHRKRFNSLPRNLSLDEAEQDKFNLFLELNRASLLQHNNANHPIEVAIHRQRDVVPTPTNTTFCDDSKSCDEKAKKTKLNLFTRNRKKSLSCTNSSENLDKLALSGAHQKSNVSLELPPPCTCPYFGDHSASASSTSKMPIHCSSDIKIISTSLPTSSAANSSSLKTNGQLHHNNGTTTCDLNKIVTYEQQSQLNNDHLIGRKLTFYYDNHDHSGGGGEHHGQDEMMMLNSTIVPTMTTVLSPTTSSILLNSGTTSTKPLAPLPPSSSTTSASNPPIAPQSPALKLTYSKNNSVVTWDSPRRFSQRRGSSFGSNTRTILANPNSPKFKTNHYTNNLLSTTLQPLRRSATLRQNNALVVCQASASGQNPADKSGNIKITSSPCLLQRTATVRSHHSRNSSVISRNSSRHGRIIRLEQKATKVLGVVFFTFVILWAPFFVLNLVPSICGKCEKDINHWVFDFVTWLGYASSMVNPIFYTIFNKVFRQAFKKVLFCQYGKQGWRPHR